MFQQLCGTNALRNVILTTTYWDRVSNEVGSRREAQLMSEFWEPMTRQGSRVARFQPSTYESAWDLIDQFDTITDVTNTTRRPALKLQTEIVDEGKKLDETSAFTFLVEWWAQAMEKLKMMMRRREGKRTRQEQEKKLDDRNSERSPSISSSTQRLFFSRP